MVRDVSATLVATTTFRLPGYRGQGGVLLGGRQFAVQRQREPIATQAR